MMPTSEGTENRMNQVKGPSERFEVRLTNITEFEYTPTLTPFCLWKPVKLGRIRQEFEFSPQYVR